MSRIKGTKSSLSPFFFFVRPLPSGLDETETALAGALANGPLNLDELARRTELESGKVAAAMTMLVLKGVVAQQAGNIFARKR